MINAAIIGCGNIAKFHFAGLAKYGAKISWACDLNLDTANKWATQHDAKATADYRDVLADDSVNLVVVATFSAYHKQICLDAIAAGKTIICEKTLAENADDALEIIQAAQKAGTLFYTSYMKRFIPVVEKAKELMPQLGTIMSSYFRSYQWWGNQWGETPADEFFTTPPGGMSMLRKSYGGGILLCGGSHILDLICFLLGRPTKLYAAMTILDGRDYELQATALMHSNNGTIHFDATAHPLDKIGFLEDSWDERFEINGTNGRLTLYSAMWDKCDVKASRLEHYDNTTGTTTSYNYGAVNPFDRALEFFCKNIEAGTQGTQAITTGYDVDELISHIQRSSAEDRMLEINWRA